MDQKQKKEQKKVMMMLNFESEDEMPKLATLQTQLQLLHTFILAVLLHVLRIMSRVSYGKWLKNL